MFQTSSAPYRSILVIQTKSLGDLVLTSALAENLRLEFPDARLVFLCEASLASFVIAHGIASEVVAFRRSSMRGTILERAKALYATVRALRRFHFDLTIDLTDTKTSRVISGLVNARNRVGYNPSERRLRLLERQPANIFAKPFGFGSRHFLYRYLSPLEALGVGPHVAVARIAPMPFETAKALALLDKHHARPHGFVAVHAGASAEGRCWQPERFAAAIDDIARQTGLGVVLVGGPGEHAIAERIVAGTASPLVNLVGALSLETLLAVLKQARLFLGNESGPMHMAAAAGTPVVGLFGMTPPSRWGPIGVPSIALQPPMPCNCVATDVCHRSRSSKACCVWRLEVETVVDAVVELLWRTEVKLERAV